MRRCNCHSAAGNAAALFGGIGIGAVLMYILDPDRGHRRRVMGREQALAFAHRTGRAVSAASRDLTNRARGAASEVRSAWGGDAERRASAERRTEARQEQARHNGDHRPASPNASMDGNAVAAEPTAKEEF